MAIPETRIGGSQEAFPETAWSSILARPDAASPERRAKLEQLCSRYWRPVYKYLRAARRHSIEDAKDLAQAYFCFVLESDLVSKYEPDRGRFRAFLKAALNTFLAGVHRDSSRLKRGGDRSPVSLDAEALETESFLADLRQRTPEEIFDRQWAEDVMAQAIVELRRQLLAEGKEPYFKVYEACDLAPAEADRPSYDQVARSLGLSVNDVRNFLHAARARLKEVLRAAVADYVASPDDLARELGDLFR